MVSSTGRSSARRRSTATTASYACRRWRSTSAGSGGPSATTGASSGTSDTQAATWSRTSAARAGGGRVEEGRAEGVDERLEEERALRRVAAAAEHAAAGGGGQVGHRVEEAGSCRCRPRPRRAPTPARRSRPAPPRRARPGRARARGRRAGSARPRSSLGASAGQVRLAQHRDVQVGGLAVRGRAELLAQPGGQVVVRRQRRARPAVGDQRAHQRPHGLLVERVGGRRSRRRPGPPRPARPG